VVLNIGGRIVLDGIKVWLKTVLRSARKRVDQSIFNKWFIVKNKE
jgi:hypothetical protein